MQEHLGQHMELYVDMRVLILHVMNIALASQRKYMWTKQNRLHMLQYLPYHLFNIINIQKQPPEVFWWKKVLQHY